MCPTAYEITVEEVLSKFDDDFSLVAEAIENGEFALWVGSGISRRAPSLGNLIEAAFDHIRERANDPATTASFSPALAEALNLAEVDPTQVRHQYDLPLKSWPEHRQIIDRLWNKYSRVLDIRVAGRDADFVLWDAIDIRRAFENPAPPAAEHLCIAILVLEGAVKDIASANWDGFIEAAVDRLSNRLPGVMQVVVDPNQLRGPAGRARLLKFHGCIEHASREPSVFRRYLTGSYTQIMDWPEKAEFAAMCNVIVGLATAHKTLVLGLSIQDTNLQTLFARAKATHAWPWPCAPDAPSHVFCEDQIQQGQRDVLRLSYGDAYSDNSFAIHEATLLRAWGEKVLIALVIKLLFDKLFRLMEIGLTSLGKESVAGELRPSLKALRDDIAELAIPSEESNDRTAFVNSAITLWSRMLCMFRTGSLPASAETYEILSSATPKLISGDQNVQAMGLGRLGVALSLLQHGRSSGLWSLDAPESYDLTSGALTARSPRPDAMNRPLFLVKSATDAISLQSQGAFANSNSIIVHGDDTWHQIMGIGVTSRRVSTPPGRTGKTEETHVSLGNLLSRCDDAETLQRQFIAEMML